MHNFPAQNGGLLYNATKLSKIRFFRKKELRFIYVMCIIPITILL